MWKKKESCETADVKWVNETARGFIHKNAHTCVWRIWKWFVFFLTLFLLLSLGRTEPNGFEWKATRMKSGKQPFIFVIILVEFEKECERCLKLNRFCPVWWLGRSYNICSCCRFNRLTRLIVDEIYKRNKQSKINWIPSMSAEIYCWIGIAFRSIKCNRDQ